MPKKKTEYELIPLLDQYITQIKKGKHVQSNGNKIKTGSIQNYLYLKKLLLQFSTAKGFHLNIRIIGNNKSAFTIEKGYWKDFYKKFTDYLYDDLNHFDNYVGATIKLLKAFFNYIKQEKGLDIGEYHKKFFTTAEEIEILVLSPERINYLINANTIDLKLTPTLQKVKDLFVFGCTVGLRYSDLINLNEANLEYYGNSVYLKVQSKKTQTFTKIKLPSYAVEIINKYKTTNKKRLLPYFNKVFLNIKLKKLMELAGFIEPIIKKRNKRGVPITIYKNQKQKIPYRFCDVVTTHTMRRTAITTMLSLGMKEQMVRKISGHAAGSKEFYRYVSFSQTYLDKEIDLIHEKLSKI